MKVSQRFHNDTYAPGIATYGNDGKTGEKGLPGTSMFFTNYSLPDDFTEFVDKITSRKLPLKTSETILERRYVNGDTFVDINGNVFMLIDIDELSRKIANGDNEGIQNMFTQIGKFNQSAPPFNKTGNALSGTSLTISDTSNNTANANCLLTLIKDDTKNADLSFINMQALHGDSPNVDLNIKFDGGLNAFVLNSQYPIVLNSNVYVQNNPETVKQLSGYSPVVTSKNSITEFVGTCKEITYSTDASIFTYTKQDASTLYYGCVYRITLIDNSNKESGQAGDEGQSLERYYSNTDINIHFQNGAVQDFQLYRKNESTYYFRQDYDYVKLNDIINKIRYQDINSLQVSLINNIECYLTPGEKVVSGFSFKEN